ncbi:MAG: DNA polymerase III subunit alpha [Planctomycetes bacterium]|nr:DNA polymerase III subunit alpha [Planctomycetota bacterium]
MNREVTNIHQHSSFSFQDGICTPEEVVAAARAKGLRSIAITDHGHTHAHARFYLEGKKQGVRTLLGTEAYVIHDFAEWRAMKDKMALEKKKDAEEVEFDLDRAARDKENRRVLYRKGHLVMVAQNRTGLANIYQLTFKAHKYGYYQKPRMDKKMLSEHSEGVIASSACMGGVISQKLWGMQRGEVEWAEVVREAREFAEIFPGRFFLELQSNEAPGQKYINEGIVRLHRETGIPLIATMDAHYVNPEDWQSQQILHMLLTHRPGAKTPLVYGKLPDTYSFDVRSLFIKTGDEWWDSFKRNNPEVPDDLLERAFENTLLADSLVEDFEPDTKMRLPSLPYEDTFEELKKSSLEGLKAKGFWQDDRYIERLGYELGIIRDKGLANYFLVVRNICDAARKEMLIGPGRGSAAGSLICYLTGITNIDPIEHKLMFERFINVDRVETPDIDLDFQDVDRVKEILGREFGEDNVACISTYGTNQIKGLLKDVCRVHDIDHNEVNKVNAQIEKEMKALYKEGETRSAITIKLEDVYRLSPTFNGFIAKYPQIEHAVKSLYGREHHVGRHASGVVIGDNLPAETSVFTSKGVVQASFTDGIVNKTMSLMGLVKFDILSLATLKVIDECCRLVALNTKRTKEEVLKEIDPKTMDFNDINVMKTVFWQGNMTGIFQVTSAGMAKLLQRVKPTCFDDVAAVCALFRPGPLGSKMDELFANRKNGLEEVTYDHPILEEIMRDTYGCLVYQEQMLEVGRRMGKMSWKDTNRLRKLFLKKDKSKQDDYIKKEEDELKAKLVQGVIENGLTAEKGEELWEMLSKFGGYGFNASHAKAYGMVTMQTAYLRTHYAMEFFAALLTVGQAEDLQTYVNDIRRQGFNILPVDVNLSGKAHKIEGNGIRLALSAVKGVGASAVEKLVANQPYSSFTQFLLDSGSNKTVVQALIDVGAFETVAPGLSVKTLTARHDAFRSDKKLSAKKNRDLALSVLAAVDAGPDDPIELMEKERELLGFNLRGTPFSINGRIEKIDRLVAEGLCEAGFKEFVEDETQRILIAPLVVKAIKERPQKNGKLFAFLKLADRDGQEYEAPCWGNVWEHVRTGVRAGDVYVTLLHRREDDPGSFVVGKPGWGHTAKQSASYFIPIDKLELK